MKFKSARQFRGSSEGLVTVIGTSPCERFGVFGFIVALLGEPQPAVQHLTLLPLMTSVGQTAGCDSERFEMWTNAPD